MPVQCLEYKRHSLLPAQRGREWTVVIRQPDQVLCHPQIAKADNYSEAIWQAQRIVDDISQTIAASP